MAHSEKPNLSFGDLAQITDELQESDAALWECLRPMLMPKKGIAKDVILAGPRPARLSARFYFVLSNYSRDTFHSEAQRYRRYPPNPNFSSWLVDLARRVEDHAIEVVHDIERHPDKDFAYHGVTEQEMRSVIRQELHEHIAANFQFVDYPPTSTPPSPYNALAQLPATTGQASQAGRPTDPRPTAAKTKGTIYAPKAITKLDAYLTKTQMSLTEFAGRAGTSDKTLRKFRQTGRIRRYIFDGIAKAMGLTREELLND
jgi:hypothetical protein